LDQKRNFVGQHFRNTIPETWKPKAANKRYYSTNVGTLETGVLSSLWVLVVENLALLTSGPVIDPSPVNNQPTNPYILFWRHGFQGAIR
jgi:hypothetical protein